jgi:hypothetical protein
MVNIAVNRSIHPDLSSDRLKPDLEQPVRLRITPPEYHTLRDGSPRMPPSLPPIVIDNQEEESVRRLEAIGFSRR